jgi:uncharacterized protein YndB with AHSA1/START domain
MEKLEFNVTIAAPAERVWRVLWDDTTYRQWTAAFAEGSRAETDWKKGSKVLFLDGNGSGMVSMIADKRDNEFMSFKHLGEVKKGVEDTTGGSVQSWAGAMENYHLSNKDGKTELAIEMDITPEFKDYFAKTWPQALARVKALAEQ